LPQRCRIRLPFFSWRILKVCAAGFCPKTSQPSLSIEVANVGGNHTPSLSPDGQQLAFAWNGGTGPHFTIYLKRVGAEERLRLTKQPAIDFNPVWSPDGHIAFCRIQKGDTELA
jgi:Tol biopolymer transport system component